MAGTGARKANVRGRASSSTMASTNAVVPTFRKVAISEQVGVAGDDVEAPVLLGVGVGLVAGVDDGPLERGLQADLGLEEVGPLGELVGHLGVRRRPGASEPTLPLPVKIWRVTKWAVAWVTIRPNGTDAVHQVVLVAAVGVALAVGVVLVDDDLLARRAAAGWRPPSSGWTICSAARSNTTTARASAHSGVEQLGVGVVDVVAGAVGEHGVDQVGLDLGRRRRPGGAPGVVAGRLVLEVPADLGAGQAARRSQVGRRRR